MNLIFIGGTFPDSDKHSLALRTLELLKILVGLGHQVTFLANKSNEGKYRIAVERLGIECVANDNKVVSNDLEQFRDYLRQKQFAVAIMTTDSMYNLYAPYFKLLIPECKLVCDTTDLAYVRLMREAQLLGNAKDIREVEQLRRNYIASIEEADSVWVVTDVERETLLETTSCRSVFVVPNIHHAEEDTPGYGDRNGMVFLGNYRHRPNADGAKYFVREILPLVRQHLPNVVFTIAGACPDDELMAYGAQYPDIDVTGFIPDHKALLKSHRVGIVSLRYGAGLKGKIGEYMSCGLPFVSTTIGIEGMERKSNMVADDPAEFAKLVVGLYNDPNLWQAKSSAGLEFIGENLSPEAVREMVSIAIDAVARQPRKVKASKQSRLWKYVQHPSTFLPWIKVGFGILRERGIHEVLKQFRVWLRRSAP